MPVIPLLSMYAPQANFLQTMSASKKSYPGSCHCKTITYKVDLTIPEQPVANRCNCTICHKMGSAMLSVADSDFKLLTPPSKSDSQVGDYVFRNKNCHRYFCKNCGVQVWASGAFEFDGQTHNFFNINALTLEPGGDIDLSQWKMKYVNGLDDAWFDGTTDTPYKGGCV
jgi:hypothetical protein